MVDDKKKGSIDRDLISVSMCPSALKIYEIIGNKNYVMRLFFLHHFRRQNMFHYLHRIQLPPYHHKAPPSVFLEYKIIQNKLYNIFYSKFTLAISTPQIYKKSNS